VVTKSQRFRAKPLLKAQNGKRKKAMRKKKNGRMIKMFCEEMLATKLHVKNTAKKILHVKIIAV